MSNKPPLTYKQAGVDIEAGNQLVERIKPAIRTTRRPGVIGGIGGFGGLFELDVRKYSRPVLVAGTDGVGTKLQLAIELNLHQTIGIDLVAMCANDVIVQGAEPLFFLDYYVTEKLDVEVATDVINGIADGCRQAGMSLLGGETAEHPGTFPENEYDLAGFCVGVVEKSRIIDGSRVSPGDAVLGLASSGPHSNGFSMIRRVLAGQGGAQAPWEDGTIGEHLLTPTRIYVEALLKLIDQLPVNALAHITGGGVLENIARVLSPELDVKLNRSGWVTQPVFHWLQKNGNISDEEMLNTFNCGLGMAVIVARNDVEQALQLLNEAGETASVIGEVTTGTGQVSISS